MILDAYIPDNKFRNRDKRFGKLGRHKGKLLKRYISAEKDCRRCQLRAKCLRYKDTKRRHFTYYVDASGQNISQAMVKKLKPQRGVGYIRSESALLNRYLPTFA